MGRKEADPRKRRKMVSADNPQKCPFSPISAILGKKRPSYLASNKFKEDTPPPNIYEICVFLNCSQNGATLQ